MKKTPEIGSGAKANDEQRSQNENEFLLPVSLILCPVRDAQYNAWERTDALSKIEACNT